ncbi:MAG: DUF1652 domain-containing protein, partial [Pseudomonas sp.]|nr:DUF1652 domain-containing protein [Pseudomonas sp.]
MSLIGVSMLEMRQMIEQACLPDRCEVSCPDGEHLTIRLGQGESLDSCLTVTGVPGSGCLRSDIPSCRPRPTGSSG